MALEDFTTYSDVVDQDSDYTITSTKVAYLTLNRTADTWHLDDKGVDFFDGDFIHTFETVVTTTNNNQVVSHWQMSNAADTPADIQGDSSDVLNLLETDIGGNKRFDMAEVVAGSRQSDTFAESRTSDPRYHTLERDESIGGNGQLKCEIFSDSGRTTLLDTLTLALNEKEDFKYVGVAGAFGDAVSVDVSGYVQNLDAGAVAFTPRHAVMF